MNETLGVAEMLGPKGGGIAAAMQAGLAFLKAHPVPELLRRVGSTITEIPAFDPLDKSALQDSFGGDQSGPSDDLLAGQGLFYVSEQRRLFLDCTSGHYQMLWGYNHPALCAALTAAAQAGIVWDNHSNIPQAPVKALAHRLVSLANAPQERDPLDTVLLGVCTGSVACAAALKIQLLVHACKREQGPPAIAVLTGNYHGTDILAQCLRGMWPGLVRDLEVVSIQPNDEAELQAAFAQHGSRMAGFWAEPILMNCEAIALQPAFLQLARQLCDQTGALMCIDEIQTGFWQPDIFAYRSMGVIPDLVIAGKGMTAGFHPLSAVVYRHRYDVLAQYDAISTNGSAALPSYLALCSLALIEARAEHIRRIGTRLMTGLTSLLAEFPNRLQTVQGRGHLAGLKFKTVEGAQTFHRRLFDAGLWTRVHAYHPGHRTVLTKLGLLADELTVDFVVDRFDALLKES